MKQETKEKTQKIPQANRAPSPFQVALQAARRVTTQRPWEEQPAEMEAVRVAMVALDEDGRRSIVFRLVNEVLEDESSLACLFSAAKMVRMVGVAHNTAAIRKAMREGNLTLTDLQNAKLAEIKLNREKKPYVVYRIGHKSLAEAEPLLRSAGKGVAAEVLAVHIRRGERNRLLAAAAKDAAATSVTAALEVTTEVAAEV